MTVDKIHIFETSHKTKDGKIIPVEVYSSLVDYFGQKAILSVARDITRRKQAEDALIKSERKFAAAFYQGNIVMTFAELDGGRIIDVNDNFCECVGYSKSEVLGRTAAELGIFSDASTRQVMVEPAKKIGSFKNIEIDFSRRNGEKRHGLFSGNIIELEGKPYLFTTMVDITERKRAEAQIRKDLEEKEVLLKEIHHRVKNNLSVMSSLLNLQARQIKTKHQALEAFKESRDRVFAMALVHEKLYQSNDFASVDMKSYLNDMSRQLINIYNVTQKIHFTLDVENVSIDINRAIPCGLILNELIINAFKHAFPEKQEGQISVSFKVFEKTSYELIVADDGIGIPENIDVEKSKSLGLNLIQMLTSQIGATWTLSREKGTTFRIVIPQEAK